MDQEANLKDGPDGSSLDWSSMGASGSRSLDIDRSRGSDLSSRLRGGKPGGGADGSSLGLSSMGTSGSPYSGMVMSSRSGGFGCSGTESDLCSQ